MKDLKEYIKEGLFDDLDKIEGKNGLALNAKQLKKEIIDWLTKNTMYIISQNKLSIDMATTPPTVNYIGDINIDRRVTSLTNNGMFQWGEVKGSFYCNGCFSLKSLEGAPKEVRGNFGCGGTNIKSLEGCPKEIGGYFSCDSCRSLETLKGAPNKIKEGFYCGGCHNLTSLKDAPKEIGGEFSCSDCYKLTSLKGAPKEVGANFYCCSCGIIFKEDDVKKVSNVKKRIIC